MRTPRAIIGLTLVAALGLSACGGGDDEKLTSSDRSKASAAALAYVGGGAVTDAERGDGDDGYAYGVEVTLPGGTEIGELGLIPGYAKTDPASGIDRYAENNRIARVRWTFEDGTSVVQRLDTSAGNRELQTIRIPRTASGTLTLEILRVQRGQRDTTAISAVEVSAAQ